ncbi:hypothetical protein MXD81_06140 [Microbacteriaceae bacterium K1510]|nr:hypothetical protein [Microbacteriaceae bacterium K1510]
MATQSSLHLYLNWAKERIDEMDATLAAFEAKAGGVHSEYRGKANDIISDLHKKRDEFQETVKKQTEVNEAAWLHTKAQLESVWSNFEAQVKSYVETAGKHMEQQQATFQQVATAQLKAWHEAADKVHAAAAQFAADRRADIDAAAERMKADAATAEAQFQKLRQAGTDSWAAFSAALTESRTAFDRANQAAWDAVKRAGGPKA